MVESSIFTKCRTTEIGRLSTKIMENKNKYKVVKEMGAFSIGTIVTVEKQITYSVLDEATKQVAVVSEEAFSTVLKEGFLEKI